MSVVIETTLGDITVDLYLNERPTACLNFLKLCKIKYYNFNLFHTISRGFIAQTGDPTGTRTGGESIFGVIDGATKRYFEAENEPRIKHTRPGLISFVGGDDNMIGSQFFLTLGEDLTYLDEKHCVFGEVVEGVDILEAINEVICDNDDRPYQDVRITHTVVLNDPLPDPKHLKVPSRSPSPSAARLAGGRIAPDEEVDETSGRTNHEIAEMQAEREAKARATILEMVGDIPDAEMAPPENVLFVCKLNPVTTDDDLEIIFSRFGKIKSCEVIRDRKTGDSLQYAFIEFEEQKSCEDAYFKMGNVLIDDRRIHVDFSQSVSKVKWLGKGRGVTHFDERGNKRGMDTNNDIGKGNYKAKNGVSDEYRSKNKVGRRQSKSPRRRSGSPVKNRSNGSLRRDRKLSRSPKRSSFVRRTPNTSRPSERHSQNRRSEERKRSISPSPVKSRRSRSPLYNRRRNRSPRQSPQRNRPSPKGRSNSFRNYTNYRSNSRNRRRSRSPLRNETSKRERSESYNDRNTRRREIPNVSSKRGHTESRERRENLENRPERSRSPRLKSVSPKNKSSSVERNSTIRKKDKSVSPKRSTKETSEKSEILESESKVIKEIKKKDKKKQKSKASKSKKKKYQTDSSSETSETDSEDDKPKKKKKFKKKVKSSSESSSSEEDSSSSSEEEKRKIKSKKRKNLKVKKSKKSKKYKKKYSSSSDSSSSESESSSSENTSSSSSSESDESSRSSKKKSKRKRTKSSSKSD